jgi:hypothetical protein
VSACSASPADGVASLGDDTAGAPSGLEETGASDARDSATEAPAAVGWTVDGVVAVGGGDVTLDVRALTAGGGLLCAELGVAGAVVATAARGDGLPATLELSGWTALPCASGMPTSLRVSFDALTPELAPAAERWDAALRPGLGVLAEVAGAWRAYGVLLDAPVAGQAPVQWTPGAYRFAAAYALPLADAAPDSGL